MKKILILFFLISSFGGAYGQSIKKESGSLNFLRSTDVVSVKFTYHNMNVGKLTEEEYVSKKVNEYNKKKEGLGDNWKEAWVGDRTQRYEPKFIELFSKYIGEKGVSVTTRDADYIMEVNVDFIEPGFNVGVARRNASINLTCKFKAKNDNEELAVVSVNNASANNFGGNDYDVGYRVQESFAKAGRELAKFLIKNGRL